MGPNNWKNLCDFDCHEPYCVNRQKDHTYTCDHYDAYEEGADAMFPAAYAKGLAEKESKVAKEILEWLTTGEFTAALNHLLWGKVRPVLAQRLEEWLREKGIL